MIWFASLSQLSASASVAAILKYKKQQKLNWPVELWENEPLLILFLKNKNKTPAKRHWMLPMIFLKIFFFHFGFYKVLKWNAMVIVYTHNVIWTKRRISVENLRAKKLHVNPNLV